MPKTQKTLRQELAESPNVFLVAAQVRPLLAEAGQHVTEADLLMEILQIDRNVRRRRAAQGL